MEHVEHALELVGEDGVGIGTDYDGGGDETNLVIPEPSRMNELWEALDKRGVAKRTLEKIAHDNFLRLLSAGKAQAGA